MFKKILLWVRQRKKHLFGFLLLLPIIVLLLPLPISREQLVSNEWCAFYPFLEWRFMADGSFEQWFVLIGEFDGVGYSDRGVWSISGGSVQVNVQKSEILRNQREFKMRSAGLGTFLWSYGDFRGQDDKGIFIVLPCSEK